MLKLIQPISKKDQVVLAIKKAILSGTIEPGETIVESKIAQQLGTGIPLVREALIRLELEGYVQKIPYKGTSVTKLGRKDVEQIFRLRLELEALAVEWAKEKATPADIEELQGILEKLKRAAREMDLDQFYQMDLAFHRRLWEMSDNPYLVDALERIVSPLFAFTLMKTARERKAYMKSAAMHEELVEVLPKMSAAELRQLMKEYIKGWRDDVLSRLPPEYL
jgi:DNA-binding GntR family transcriptional regulator